LGNSPFNKFINNLCIGRGPGGYFGLICYISWRENGGIRVGFPFANCAIFAKRNAKFFFLCASVLREIALYCAFAKLKFCTFPQLEFCAIPQIRKNQTVGDGVRVFLRIQFWKNLVLECLPIGQFYIIDQ